MFEENEDPRNLDSVWDDIEEYELPETTFNNVSGDYIGALTVKVISATNHYSLLSQYEPKLRKDIMDLEFEIEKKKTNRKSKIYGFLSDQKSMPHSVKRTKDLMLAYIESNSGKKELMIIDKEILINYRDLIIAKEKIERLLGRKKSIENVIVVGVAILNNYKGD